MNNSLRKQTCGNLHGNKTNEGKRKNTQGITGMTRLLCYLQANKPTSSLSACTKQTKILENRY